VVISPENIMPRRKLARRFEPRYGVSQTMLDAECRYIARELEDYLLQSTNELRETLGKRQALIGTAEEELQAAFRPLPDRERLALRCMFARDCWHMAMLYKQYLGKPDTQVATATGPSSPAPEELDQQDEPVPMLPFKETLFR
jgi:hypothetical protein